MENLYIKAINPGYTVDGRANVGEFVELARTNSDTPMSLAGLIIGYTNSSGNFAKLYEFPENSWMIGESILLRLASSPDSELADLVYIKTLAMSAGPLQLLKGDDIIDSVCWNGKEGCEAAFSKENPTTLLKNVENGIFEHVLDYEPDYDKEIERYHVDEPEIEVEIEETPPKQCEGIIFSEIFSYYADQKTDQFIEFFNPTSEKIQLNNCKIKYKNKFYDLSGEIPPNAYFIYRPTGFSLTKNPTTFNIISLIDADGSVAASIEYPNGQKKSASYALIGYDKNGEAIWKNTYKPTPGTANVFQEWKTCEKGKIINEDTGNCVKINFATSVKTCKEGYYLNEETNRCNKIKENTGADYEIEKEVYRENTSFVAIYAILIMVAIGVIYVIFQFRHEIKKFFHKVFQRFQQKLHHGSGPRPP